MLAGAYPLADIEEVLARVRRLFALAIPLAVLVAAGGGYLLARRSLAPLAAMTSRASAISATTLDDRLPIGGGTELVGLAVVINDLLDRLERSFDQQRRFMADASHELRTPTAIIRSEADVTLSRNRGGDEYRASIEVMGEAARRLSRIVGDLFLLARADAGHLVARRESIYLEEVMRDVARAVRPMSEQRGVSIALSAPIDAPLEGDADLLGRLFLNLLDNAIKHSPSGAAVGISMRVVGGAYVIDISDAGPGIPAELQSRVFERFFRVDSARSREMSESTSGAGLGLAIARRIAELHGGTLQLAESRPGLTRFRVTLPAESAGESA
jgi:heavy metal sensor kinase